MDDGWEDSRSSSIADERAARFPVASSKAVPSKSSLRSVVRPDTPPVEQNNDDEEAMKLSKKQATSLTARLVLDTARRDRIRHDRARLAGVVPVPNSGPLSIRVFNQPRLLVGGNLQPHQLVGLQTLIVNRAIGSGTILADDMGLGKTIQVTSFFAQLLEWYIEDHNHGSVDDLLKTARNAIQPAELSRLMQAVKASGTVAAASAIAPASASSVGAGACSSSADVDTDVAAAHDSNILLAKMKALQKAMDKASTTAAAAPQAVGAGAGSSSSSVAVPSNERTPFPRIRPDYARRIEGRLSNTADDHNVVQRGSAGPHLVIAPSSTLDNWRRELDKWCPFLSVAVFGGEKKDRDALKKSLHTFNVVVTSYAVVGGEGWTHLQKVQWDTLVLDEAHGAKNSESAKFERIMGLDTSHRVLLTGTPVQNNLGELITLLRLILPDMFLYSEDGKYKADDDVGLDEEDAAASREAREAQALVLALQREVDDMVKKAKKDARDGKARGKDKATGGDAKPTGAASGSTAASANSTVAGGSTAAPASVPSLSDMLSVYVLRRVKEGLSLGLLPKTRLTAWVQPCGTQAGALSTLHRTVLALAPHSGLAKAVRAAMLAGSEVDALSSTVAAAEAGAGASGNASPTADLDWAACGPHLYVADLHDVLAVPEDGPGGAGAGASSSVTSSPTSSLVATSGSTGKLLMMLRKAAIHPLLLRMRYSNAQVLAMARIVHGYDDQDEEQDAGAGAGASGGAGGKRGRSGAAVPGGSALKGKGTGKAKQQAAQTMEPRTLEDVAGATSAAATASGASSAQPPSPSDESFAGLLSTACSPMTKADLLPWANGDRKLANAAYTMLQLSDLELDRGYVAGEPRLAAYALPWAAYEDSAKIVWLRDVLLPQLRANKSRALLFSQFTDVLDILELVLERWGEGYDRLDGSTKVADRQALIDSWSRDASRRLMLLSTKAGGVGINLTAADTVVFMDCDWNPTNDAQAEDRAYRIGQTRPVTVHRLMSRGTLELHMAAIAEGKSHLATALMGISEKPGAVGLTV